MTLNNAMNFHVREGRERREGESRLFFFRVLDVLCGHQLPLFDPLQHDTLEQVA
ncbi:MAG: hypothetical protein WKF61_03785 [Luteimonas sp.]